MKSVSWHFFFMFVEIYTFQRSSTSWLLKQSTWYCMCCSVLCSTCFNYVNIIISQWVNIIKRRFDQKRNRNITVNTCSFVRSYTSNCMSYKKPLRTSLYQSLSHTSVLLLSKHYKICWYILFCVCKNII